MQNIKTLTNVRYRKNRSFVMLRSQAWRTRFMLRCRAGISEIRERSESSFLAMRAVLRSKTKKEKRSTPKMLSKNSLEKTVI